MFKYNVGERKKVVMPAYRKPDGKVMFCYSPHKPDYCGFEAGFGTFDRVTCFYPNETYGYEYHAISFEPLEVNQNV